MVAEDAEAGVQNGEAGVEGEDAVDDDDDGEMLQKALAMSLGQDEEEEKSSLVENDELVEEVKQGTVPSNPNQDNSSHALNINHRLQASTKDDLLNPKGKLIDKEYLQKMHLTFKEKSKNVDKES